MRIFTLPVGLAVGLVSLPRAYAWGAAGHEIVATIAQIHLSKPVLSLVCDILHPSLNLATNPEDEAYPPCHLASIASWADKIRMRPEYRYTAPLHYVNAVDDAPPHACPFPGTHGWQGRPTGNILAAIGNVTHVLRDFVRGERGAGDAEEALKFLVHFMGDMHQPLHMSGREKGGNGVRVAWNGRVTNLHSVWDGLLIAQAVRLTPRNYTYPLPGSEGAFVEPHLRGAIYDPYIRRIMHEGLSVGGKFDPESDAWSDCPAPAAALESATDSLGAKGTVAYALSLLGLGDSARMEALLDLDFYGALGLTTRPGTENEWDDESVCPYAWARPIHDAELRPDSPCLPYDVVDFLDMTILDGEESAQKGEGAHAQGGRPRHPELLELDTPAYAGRLARGWVVERLLAMAGVRLAGVLTDIFADMAGDLQA
ncbi:hypothetical protein ONZ51_g109 [Trametes cubensis]|uniref:Phospholipase C/P1 nuclease n=1 Tax=Trametes cubensis TaxID=1111947 RepID=A0AAD7XJ13_9APHY|nr:hypothetical protein ONZ51_g109 [Trametes cubensis]